MISKQLTSAWKHPKEQLAKLAHPIAQTSASLALSGMLAMVNSNGIHTGSLTVDLKTGEAPNKTIFHGSAGDNGPNGHIVITNPYVTLSNALRHGKLGLGEAYIQGGWQAKDNDLISLLHAGLKNGDSFSRFFNGHGSSLKKQNNTNKANYDHTAQTDAEAIGVHYDHDANTFYRPWLGSSMMYTSGIGTKSCTDGNFYGVTGDSLEDMQQRKINRILHMLNPQYGEKLLEIGCGWGNFAIEAGKRGAQVTAITISEEQYHQAARTVQLAGLSDTVKIVIQDYRELDNFKGHFDYVASIGMIEHVGDLNEYMHVVSNSMRTGGEALLHYITTQEDDYDVYLQTLDFMQKYIFPNGKLTTVSNSKRAIAEKDMQLLDHFQMGESYGDTLREWNNRFQDAWEDIEKTNPEIYTPKFKRMWEFYLTSCAAAFYAEQVNVNQFHMRNGPA